MLSSVTVFTDASNYCRYDPRCNRVGVHVEWGAAAGGETLAVSLLRQDGWGVVGTTSIPVTAAGAGSGDGSIALEACLDNLGIYRAHSGYYTVSVSDGTSTWASDQFTLTTISVGQLRHDLLKGLPLVTSETVEVLEQPQRVTGVSVEEVYPETFQTTYPLVYAKAANTLSWAGGPPVSCAVRWNSLVTLFSAGVRDYIRVRIRPNLLPAADTSETLVVDRRHMTDAELERQIFSAEGFIMGKTWISPEPIRAATPVSKSLNPTQFYDRVAMPIHFLRNATPFQFLELMLPYTYILALHELRGAFNTTSVVLVGPEWQDVTSRNGMISLVPRNGAALQWQFYGGFFFNLLMAYPSVPDFWHYDVSYGLSDMRNERSIMLDAIGRRAAIETLAVASLQNKPGYAAENIARDGVASSIAYAHGFGGVYSETITYYANWLDEQITKQKLRQTLVGVKAVFL